MESNSGKHHTGQHGGRLNQGREGQSSFKKMPITLTKSELAQILDCWKKGRIEPNYKKLRSKFFTADVLNRIGITRQQYNRIKEFNRELTIKIIEVLQIENEAHEYAKDRI